MDSILIFSLDRINRIYRIIFFLHQIAEEIDETPSSFGENTKFGYS